MRVVTPALAPSPEGQTLMRTILLLLLSNIFMTFAWYGHLKFRTAALWVAILASWGIAFFEYCLQVPANRLGYFGEVGAVQGAQAAQGPFSASQLKTIQEIITLVVFVGFSVMFLREPLRWNHLVGFGFIVLAAMFIFKK
jgi:uncharacterized protein (DUF486 family)